MSLEDRIIAFLDGGLTPTERAALLREVHRDPRAKELLESHRMLRSLAKASARRIHAPAHIASQLAAIAATAPPLSVAPIGDRRRRLVPLTLLLLGAVGISAVLFVRAPGTQEGASTSPSVATASVVSPQSLTVVEEGQYQSLAVPSANSTHRAQRTYMSLAHIGGSDQIVSDAGSMPTQDLATVAHPQYVERSDDVKPVAVREIVNDISGGASNARTLGELRHSETSQTASRFEASLQTSSGFTSPADAQPIKPFAQQRLGLGYYITSSDVLGIRVTSGLYQVPGAPVSMTESGVTLLQQSLVTRRSWGGEVYASHRFGQLFNTPVAAVITAAGGLIPNGFTVGAEAGLRIPASERFAFAVDFSLSRVHSNIDGATTVLANANSSQAPVMFIGTNVRNTLNGSLHYGLQYTF